MEIGEEKLGKLVASATAEATQKVAAIHRKRLVRQTALVTFVIACAVAIPTTLVLNGDTEATGRHNAQRNCVTQANARPQGNARAFDQIAFLELLEEATTASRRNPQARAFFAASLARVNRLARYWRPYTGKELPKKITGFEQLAATIKPLPLLDCAHQVTG